MSGLYKRALDFVARHPHLRVLKPEELEEEDDGISEDERAQISAQIQAVVSQNKLRLDDQTLELKPRKRGWVFVLFVNLIAAAVIAAGIYLALRLFESQEQELVSERRVITSVEGELLDALQAEAEAQLSAKDQEIQGIEGRLAQVTAEREQLQEQTDEIIASREAELREQFEAALEAERERLEAAGLSAAEIDAQVAELEAQQTAQLEAELEAVRAEAEAEIAAQEAEFEAEIAAFQAELDAAAAERATLEEEFAAEAEALNAQLAEETARLESERASLIAEFDAEVAQIRADFQRRLQEAQAATQTAVETQEAALAERDATLAELEATQNELSTTEAALADTEAALAGARGDLTEALARARQAEADADAARAEAEEAVAAAEASRAEAREAQARAATQTRAAEIARAEAEEAGRTAEAAVGRADAAEAAALAAVAQAEERVLAAEEAAAAAEARAEELAEEAQAAQARVQTALAAADDAAAERDRLAGELADVESRFSTLQGNFNAAGAALSQALDQYDTVLSRIEAGDLESARVALSSIRRAVNEGAREAVPSLANRSELELLLVDSLDRLVTVEIAAAGSVEIDLVATANLVAEATSLLRQGQELEDAGEIGAATELYRAAVAQVPAAGAAFARIEALTRSAQAVDSQALSEAVAAANELYTQGNYRDAATAYQEVLNLLPNVDAATLDNILDTGYRLRSAVDRVAFVEAAAEAEAQIEELQAEISGLESEVSSLEQQVSTTQNRYVDIVQSIDRALARIRTDQDTPAATDTGAETTELLATKLVLLRVLNSDEVREDYPDLYTETQVYLDALVEEERSLAERETLQQINSLVETIGAGGEPSLPDDAADRRLVQTFLERLSSLLSVEAE